MHLTSCHGEDAVEVRMRMGGKWVIIWGYWVGFKAEEKGALCGSKLELVKWGGGVSFLCQSSLPGRALMSPVCLEMLTAGLLP